MLKGFKAFMMRGNIVDLAIAVVIGAAFGAVITALVQDLLTPLIAAVFGQSDFSALDFEINDSVFRYGHFLNAMISFLTIAAAIYFVVVVPMLKMAERRRRGEPTEDTPAPSDEAVLLTEIRDLLASRREP